ncbi:uroporphyrinogen III methyltransferase [Mesorhizobium sp. L-8-10]|uniref:uroporphyrinogen-III synthase n=1 Tax=unclassified Mesorhizobium TaxID=325217 RepID=UPI0019293F8C|nr:MULTISPECIES: uroporphyrinogen-III synthase [unclassified Mesorhizobium]BCH22338.1 uroporphyrinogen III methyltransferase [Mesorhizobium sp. L-8-3]BCH30151.1 uroporphyrinogen III methyltransferase [Mesorhizobium sp. L-8-10]
MSSRVLVTRPQPGAGATARRLDELGFEAVVLPLTEIRELAVDPLPAASPIDAVVVTSANAVRHAPRELLSLFLDRPCFAVGAETAAAAGKSGFSRVAAGTGDAAGLARLVTDTLPPGARILYLCGRVRLVGVEDRLRRKGMHVAIAETYDAPEVVYPIDELTDRLGSAPLDAALLHSARAASGLAGLVSLPGIEPLFAKTLFLCLSDRVAAALRDVGEGRVFAAPTPDEAALLALLRQRCGNGA